MLRGKAFNSCNLGYHHKMAPDLTHQNLNYKCNNLINKEQTNGTGWDSILLFSMSVFLHRGVNSDELK